MVSDEHAEPANLRELRILVLHNRDFDGDGASASMVRDRDEDRDLQEVSRFESATTAENVSRGLVSRGHFVEVQALGSEDLGDLLAQLRKDPPDLVFNLCKSLGGDARHEILVPSLLELLGIPYTGSGSLCLGLCLHKFQTKQILRAASIPTPPSVMLPVAGSSVAEELAIAENIGYPLILKLGQTDGSVGISDASIIHNDEAFLRQLAHLRRRYRQPILAERYIAGREIYVSMLGNAPLRILPMQEVDFSQLPSHLAPIVGESAKWEPSSPEYQGTSAVELGPMPGTVRARVELIARQAFSVLDVSDYGRCDIRLSANGTPYVIDVNANCALADGAGFARSAALAGLSYDQLVEQIAISALQRAAHLQAQKPGERDASERVSRSARRPASAA